MKNIQIIDGAANCTFSVFQATDAEFMLLFPEPQQDIQYAEDLLGFPQQDKIQLALGRILNRPLRKRDALGIHGTLFFELQRYKKWYREKREDAVEPAIVNQAQRHLFSVPGSASDRAKGMSLNPEGPGASKAIDLAPQVLRRLQDWYQERCNGDWEHTYGIEIGTLDNPGWLMTVDLADTCLSTCSFDVVAFDGRGENDWYQCKVASDKFQGACGPGRLGDVIQIFLDWAAENRQ